MSKFQKVVERMDEMGDILVMGDGKISTPSGATDMIISITLDDVSMCTIKSTDSCPVGFKSSNICVGQNDSDINTNHCVVDTNYISPS